MSDANRNASTGTSAGEQAPFALYVVSANRENGAAAIPLFIREQADALRAEGWRVDIEAVENRTSPMSVWGAIRRLRARVRELDPDLVHAQYGSVTAMVTRLSAQGRSMFVSYCGDDLLGTPIPGFKWRVRERMAYLLSVLAARQPMHILVKSTNLRDALPKRMRPRAHIVLNGTNLQSFELVDRDAARKDLGWPLDGEIVLFNRSAGDNAYVKNLPLALEAMDVVNRSRPGAILKAISRTQRDEVVKLMNAADCLLVTSYHEGSPDIVKEAMACNLAVVSVPCGDVVERLEDPRAGTVAPYDAEALGQAIDAVLASGSRSNGRQALADQRATLDDITPVYDRLYREALARPRVQVTD